MCVAYIKKSQMLFHLLSLKHTKTFLQVGLTAQWAFDHCSNSVMTLMTMFLQASEAEHIPENVQPTIYKHHRNISSSCVIRVKVEQKRFVLLLVIVFIHKTLPSSWSFTCFTICCLFHPIIVSFMLKPQPKKMLLCRSCLSQRSA